MASGITLAALVILPLAVATAQTSQIEWSPRGNIALEARDARVWLIDGRSGRRTVLTATPRNIVHFEWTPDGNSILFAGTNSLDWFDLRTRATHNLLTSKDALADVKISPDGRWLGFIRQHNLFLFNLRTHRVSSLSPSPNARLLEGELDPSYSREFGLKTAYWWAPDSSSIAYLETDKTSVDQFPLPGGTLPKIRLNLVRVDTRLIRQIKPAGDYTYLVRVNWLPDSKRLAVQYLDREQNATKLLLVDSKSSARPLIAEKDDYWINLHDDLYFFRDNRRFIWSSERSGHRHLYLYDLDGKRVRQLTSGDWDVFSVVGVDEVHRVIYFTASEKNPLERHLYRAGLDGSGFARITRQTGWHDPVLSPAQDAFLDSYSDVSTPPLTGLFAINGSPLAALEPRQPVFKHAAEFLRIPLHDGVSISALMIKPAGFDPARKYPVIVHTYGGPDGRVVRNAWDGCQMEWQQSMADKGFIVFAVDPRGSAGYGHLFEEPIHYRFGAQELADLRETVSYLRRLSYVDSARLGIWGSGYGGHTVVHAMLEFPSGFRAAFAISPIADWTQYNAFFTERYLGLLPARRQEYDDSSALGSARKLTGKLMVAAGPSDDVQVRALQDALEKAHKQATFSALPADPASLLESMTAFFTRNL